MCFWCHWKYCNEYNLLDFILVGDIEFKIILVTTNSAKIQNV